MNPTLRPLSHRAEGCQPISGGEALVDLNGSLEEQKRFLVVLELPCVIKRNSAQEEIVGIDALGWLPSCTLDFSVSKSRLNGAKNACGNAVLKIEDIFQRTIESLGPNVSASGGVDQLGRDSNAVFGLTHAAFKQISHAKLAADLLHVDCFSLVNKA